MTTVTARATGDVAANPPCSVLRLGRAEPRTGEDPLSNKKSRAAVSVGRNWAQSSRSRALASRIHPDCSILVHASPPAQPQRNPAGKPRRGPSPGLQRNQAAPRPRRGRYAIMHRRRDPQLLPISPTNFRSHRTEGSRIRLLPRAGTCHHRESVGQVGRNRDGSCHAASHSSCSVLGSERPVNNVRCEPFRTPVSC